MKAVLWTTFLLTLLFLWGREVLNFGAARREKADPKRDELRFRRRTLGLSVLFLLGVLYELHNDVPFAEPVHELAYYGVMFVVVIWLLIIAARDMRAIAESYLDEQQRMTLQSLVELEEQLRGSAETDPDNRPIPLVRFDHDNEEET